MYEPRTYRKQFNLQRFYSFDTVFRETDLWIGVDHKSYVSEMKTRAYKKVVELRRMLDEYIQKFPEIEKSLIPLTVSKEMPSEVQEMIITAAKTEIGPMSAVAGLFAQEIGKDIIRNFKVEELIVENGGDIFFKLKDDLMLSVYAGDSIISEKIGIAIPAKATPCGVCTSAGTVGPSLSYGIADAVMVACKRTTLADAFATAFCNKIKSVADIDSVLKLSEEYPEIQSIIIICNDKVGIRGNFEVKMIK